MIPATKKVLDKLRVDWGSWAGTAETGRVMRRRRRETLRRIEGLEDRTLMAAAINIDAAGFLTYDTDAAVPESLTVSVSGATYTFASSEMINLDSNVAGLTVVGAGTNLVTVVSPIGLQLDVNGDMSTVTLESTNVATGITLYSSFNDVTLGSAASLVGLDSLASAVTVSEDSDLDDNALTLIDTGLIETSVIYNVTATTIARVGFGGLTYSGLEELTLRGATGAVGQTNTYNVSGTADGTATWLDDSANAGDSTFNVTGTSAIVDEATSLRIQGGQGDSAFNVSAASSAVNVWAGVGDNLLTLTSSGSTSNIAGAVTVFNALDSAVDVLVDHSAGTADTAWNLVMVSEGELEYAQLTGFSVGGALNFAPTAVDQVTLRNAVGQTNSLRVDFGAGNPLPAQPLSYDGGWSSPSAAKSDLILVGDPEVAIVDEVHTPSGPSAGAISFEDVDAAATSISYTSISPNSVYDTLVAVDYTFVYAGAVGVEVLAGENSASTGNVQTLLIASAAATPEFADTHLGNKANVTVSQVAGGDQSTVVNYGLATPVAGLVTLSIITGAGDDEARLLSLPAGAATSLQQGGGSDQAFLSLAGTDGATLASLDGGPGVDALVIDADGLSITAANFAAIGIVGSISGVAGAAPISYTRYESVVVTNVAPIETTVYSVPIHAVRGQALVNVLVGAFTTSAPARASDFVATLTWGDGTTTAGVIVQDASNPSVFYIYGTHTYYDEVQGLPTAVTVNSLASTTTSYIGGVPVTLVTPAGAAVTTAGLAFVDGAPVQVTVNNVSGYENIPIAASGSIIVATFVDFGGVNPSDPNPAANFSARIYWGDGSDGVSDLTIVRNTFSNVYIVYAAPHTYATPGSYVVTVVVFDAGSPLVVGLSTATAVIADAPLSPTASQPTTSTVREMEHFDDMAIASFVDANPLARPEEYTVVIDWGDGSPNSLGRVVQPGGVGTTFYVLGSHTYADSLGVGPIQVGPGPIQGPVLQNGVYSLKVAVRDTFGSAVNLTNFISVSDRLLTVSGALDAASDTGESDSDGVTSDATPTFSGVASEGGALVFLYASLNGAQPVLIGSTTADSSGAWSVTPAAALADGGYWVGVQAYDAERHSVSAITTVAASLVIDTVGPRLTDLTFDNYRGQVLATFRDYGGIGNDGVGLAQASLRDANNFRFAKLAAAGRGAGRFLATSIDVTPGTRLGDQVAMVRFNGGAGIRGGRYLFTARSVTPGDASGIRDLAGNAFDGEFYGYFASGNRVNGGDLVAGLDARHHTIFAPRTQVGTASPVVPPGRPATGRFLRLDGSLLPSAGSAVRLSSARAALRRA